MTATQLGWLGVWLFIGSSAVIVLELALAGAWSFVLARRSQVLALALQKEQVLIQADIARLQAAVAETRVLWRPYRRVLRWLSHPLVRALFVYYWRRL
jgi:hypothetical protein